jgi:hypothetical protein
MTISSEEREDPSGSSMRDLPAGAADDVFGKLIAAAEGSNIRCQMFSLTYCSERAGCRTSPLHDISTCNCQPNCNALEIT